MFSKVKHYPPPEGYNENEFADDGRGRGRYAKPADDLDEQSEVCELTIVSNLLDLALAWPGLA